MIQTARSAPLGVAAREAGGIYSSPPTSAARHLMQIAGTHVTREAEQRLRRDRRAGASSAKNASAGRIRPTADGLLPCTTFLALLDAAARAVIANHPLSPWANLRPCETVTDSVRVAQRKNAAAVTRLTQACAAHPAHASRGWLHGTASSPNSPTAQDTQPGAVGAFCGGEG